MTISIRVISNPNGLLEIEDSWNKLVHKHSKNPFCLSVFVKQFMELYRSEGWTPLVLVISADKKIIGMAPLITKRKFGVRFVKLVGRSWFPPDFIVEDQYRETCLSHTLDFLFRTLRCQFVELTLPAESPNLRILKQSGKAYRIRFCTKTRRWADRGHCILPIKCTWHEFKASRGKNFRKKFKKMERHLDRAGSWRIACVDNRNKESDVFQRILDVERRSWKELVRTQKGEETDPDLLVIWKGSQHTAKTESNFNWHVWFLDLNNQTLAYTLVLQYKETAFIMKTSYDARYRRLYPGIYVNNAAISELFNGGHVRNIDFLTDLPFHRTWTSTCPPRVKVLVSRKGVSSFILGAGIKLLELLRIVQPYQLGGTAEFS